METPRRITLLGRVTDDEIMTILRTLPRRTGIARFARLLGFARDLKPCRPPRSDAASVRSAITARRGALRLHAVRLRRPISASLLRSLLRTWNADSPAAHHIAVVLEPRGRRVAIACDVLADGLRHIVVEPAAVRPVDVEIVRELAQATARDGTAAAFGVLRALDRRTLTNRFFRDVRAVRDLVARAWTGVPRSASADRDALALLLLSRLMFLYFLQRNRLLAGDDRFLPDLLAQWRRQRQPGSFYRGTLRTLFFGVLNRRPERRTARAAAFGALPYLNGGLFEQHRIEQRYPSLDLPDDGVAAVFDMLLERYRFTAADTADRSADDVGGGIDPELLGRIFEGLMPHDRRSSTGTFYTPAETVDRLVVECLAQHLSAGCGIDRVALGRLFRGEPHDLPAHELHTVGVAAGALRVLDPACGSGAFLLGALARLAQLRRVAGDGAGGDLTRRDIVASSLHGVDLLDDAALICALRVWLALVPHCASIEAVPPLPNLDRCIRQGDALVDPLDSRMAAHAWRTSRRMRAIVRQLQPAGREYVTAGPESRASLRRRILRLESGLARAWIETEVARTRAEAAELRARGADRDLFGEPTSAAAGARGRLPGVERRLAQLEAAGRDLAESGALPFFSFPVHFATVSAGFDVVISNPPWVRAHAWPAASALLRERYRVCETAGWPFAAHATHTPSGAGSQVDLAFLFLERSLQLLRPGGTLGMVLPAKLVRSLAPGGARALLLRQAPITRIDDYSLDQRAVFRADAFTAVVIARRIEPCDDATVDVRMTRSGVADLAFTVKRAELSLRPDDDRAPWLLAPPSCAAALRFMQRTGRALHEAGWCVRRGAMTNANGTMLLTRVKPRFGNLAEITTVDGTSGIVEEDCVRPVLRGTDVRAWCASPVHHVLWSPANDDAALLPPRRFSAFLERRARSVGRDHAGTLERISPGMFGHKVVWSDLASDLRAAAVPEAVKCCGSERPVVPLNTVYFIPTGDRDTALLLSAYLNSLPLRTFARAIAERAKDAHFRFFAWTVAMLPLPADWRANECAQDLVQLAARAHDDGAMNAGATRLLDDLVARSFALSTDHVAALHSFDCWLKGGAGEHADG